METGPALSTAPGRRIYVKSDIRDLFSLSDVLYEDQFEGDDPTFTEQEEENFYRGAPPNWLNFHINEQEASSGTGTLFIKRDGFEKLKEEIQMKRKLPAMSTVKLFHQSGSGGTTMAMQALWDLKKTFRCAVLTNSASNTTRVAQEVVHLFTAGSLGHQNTVLLLLNDEQILDKLQESIMMTVKKQNIVTHMPVAVLLSCVRKDILLQSKNVFLKRELSENEQQKFNEKKKELTEKYGEKIREFHGFNIMQTNFSEEYINKACQIIRSCSKARRPLKAAAFLSLLNAYVPGSYLLESQCLDFLKEESNAFADVSTKDKMQPFSHLIVTFQEDERTERKVRMAHPLIAKCCTEVLADKGVTRSDTARNFLNNYDKYEDHGTFPIYLLNFIKDMLTKREFKTKLDPNSSLEVKGEKERFSKLILDIQQDDKVQCAPVLKVASNKFPHDPFFPQALARFYYIELKDYNLAEMWAKRAKERDPQNSFIADTLGQVHKNCLKNIGETSNPRQVLLLAKKAIEAFKHEEQLAEEEHQMDISGDRTVQFSNMFNCRGQFGFVQVCNLLYDLLVKKNERWEAVLTKKVSFGSVLKEFGDNKLYRFNDLVNNLKGDLQKKAEFFAEYLTFSKLSIERDDPEYISEETYECQKKFVGYSLSAEVIPNTNQCKHELQQNLATTSAGVLACMDREYSEDLLKCIAKGWKKVWSKTKSRSNEANYILAYILSRNLRATFPDSPEALIQSFKQGKPPDHSNPPEQHMLALLLSWPANSENKSSFDLNQQIQEMGRSYEKAYRKYFRSRYLLPLFFIGKGQDLDRLVHRKVLEHLFFEHSQGTDSDCKMKDWTNEDIFKDGKVKERLIKFEGVVRNYSLFLPVGSKQIEIEANLQRSLWKARQVSFFLGFTIRGPVAFDIQTKKVERELRELEGSNPEEPV
ncbi:sterile alpha motif domain-containing protein 9-like [Poecilia latipinna]|uniref:sterile alpha motif domain-containing protein 9-like n=1 Tax=Poecilia latipinna TaxID=48699 RepID=UPI00072DDAAE|nr:PREDICTED: sterile alpha motif domain-containing protein 9-like [Poecilia latipinna]